MKPPADQLKVVAFLQNMYLNNPERARQMIARDTTGKLRSRLIAYALFAGCFTGRRLKMALGDEWCDSIIWDEASPLIGDKATDCPPPDREHIKGVLEKHKPDLVICFSRPAERVIRSLCTCWLVVAPHPAARHRDVGEQLKRVRVMLDLFQGKKLAGEVPNVKPEELPPWMVEYQQMSGPAL